MKYLEVERDDTKLYVLPIGDVHVGDPSFNNYGRDKLLGYLKWAREENAMIFLNGDIFNVGGRNEKTSPFETDAGEYQEAISIFEPYKDLIIGAIEGNHEHRLIDEYGFSPTQLLCHTLKVPYCGYSAVVRFKVGKRPDSPNRWYQNYFGYFHHTTGGGGNVGSKLNRVAKLMDIVEGMDFFVGSHNHQLAVAPVERFYPSIQERAIKKRRVVLVDAGSFVSWGNNYAEMNMYPPTKLGAPRIRLDGRRNEHEVHVSV